MSKYRIVIVDDHALIRRGLRNIIEKHGDLAVAGEAADGDILLKRLSRGGVEMVLLDISMPGMSGLDLLPILKERYPGIKVLVLTMHKGRDYIFSALSSGADGYLLKDDSDLELLVAIGKIRQGEVYVSPLLSSEVTHNILAMYREGRNSLNPLISAREKQVLQLVVQGCTSREAGVLLGVSRRTIENHRNNMLRKFSLKSSAELVRYALDHGLVVPSGE
ncbi:MAG: hypothetical protein BWK76_25040 [Desulfobulbaceae bacterium A2]|nr:MAG: hypothetical protein BWK76_25040 [Desulfobulbaceae bacterium A2]